MNLARLPSWTIAVDSGQRDGSLRAACVAALWLTLVPAALAPAQDSSMKSLFDGVHRGTEQAEVRRDPPVPQGMRPVGAEPTASRQRPGRLQQPARIAGNAVWAQHTEQVEGPAREIEALPAPQMEGTLPISGWDANVDIVAGPDGRIDRLVVRDASLSKVLSLLAQSYNLNIVAANDIDAVISITLRDVALDEALTAILSVANYTWVRKGDIILVTAMSGGSKLPAEIQGRQMQVFELDFASATGLLEAVTGFLSPVGRVSISASDSNDNRRTREIIVVEDLPEAIERIAAYVEQVDQPPRQVLLEAHILQVNLKDNDKNGVNFDLLLRAAGSNIRLSTPGFASRTASPSFLATVEGGDLSAVIECLQSTTDTKTLGSPKVMVLNQQEAMIHVGEDIGYQGSQTTTETSTFQNVQFLQVGVVLHLTPRITRDGRVLLHVRPEVSTGAINPATNVPDKATTELETDVMLNDGQGMIIGGLIKELDSTVQSKIPYLGDLWRAGFLFRRSDVTKERLEIIVAIVPRILPYTCEYQNFDQGEFVKAATPLFQGPLKYTERPWDPVLPDGLRVAKPYCPTLPPLPQMDRNRSEQSAWPRYYVPHKPYPHTYYCDGDNSAEHSQDMTAEQLAPEFDGQAVPEDAFISDQP